MEVINYFNHFFQHNEKGINPIVGQIFGVLIQSENPVSLIELTNQLNLSKAAISIQIRILNQLGYCVKLPRRKDRQDYYIINDYFFEQVLENKLRKDRFFLEDMNRLMKKGSETPCLNKRFQAFQFSLLNQIEMDEKLLCSVKNNFPQQEES